MRFFGKHGASKLQWLFGLILGWLLNTAAPAQYLRSPETAADAGRAADFYDLNQWLRSADPDSVTIAQFGMWGLQHCFVGEADTSTNPLIRKQVAYRPPRPVGVGEALAAAGRVQGYQFGYRGHQPTGSSTIAGLEMISTGFPFEVLPNPDYAQIDLHLTQVRLRDGRDLLPYLDKAFNGFKPYEIDYTPPLAEQRPDWVTFDSGEVDIVTHRDTTTVVQVSAELRLRLPTHFDTLRIDPLRQGYDYVFGPDTLQILEVTKNLMVLECRGRCRDLHVTVFDPDQHRVMHYGNMVMRRSFYRAMRGQRASTSWVAALTPEQFYERFKGARPMTIDGSGGVYLIKINPSNRYGPHLLLTRGHDFVEVRFPVELKEQPLPAGLSE